MRFPPRSLAAFVVLGLFLTACSDEGSSSPNDVGGDEAGADPYCVLSGDAAALAADFDPSSAAATDTEAFYRELLELTDDALGVVPDTLADDLAVQRSVLIETIDVLDGVGWDLSLAVDELTPLYLSPEYLAADESLERFDVDECGVESMELVPAEPLEIPADYAAYCDASFAVSQADGLPFDAGPAEVQIYYEGLLDNLGELAALAPPELEADLQLILVNFVEVADILAGVDWDLDAGSPLVEEWAADPARAEPIDAAIVRVEGVDVEICGIVY
jgi:hypothetical protein